MNKHFHGEWNGALVMDDETSCVNPFKFGAFMPFERMLVPKHKKEFNEFSCFEEMFFCSEDNQECRPKLRRKSLQEQKKYSLKELHKFRARFAQQFKL